MIDHATSPTKDDPLPPDQADRGELLRRINDALLHYGIGSAAAGDLLPVDWCYVCHRMYAALRGRDGDE